MATPACEEFDFIKRRMVELLPPERVCPLNAGRTLTACLQNLAPCQEHCPHRDKWVGPAR